MWIKLGITHLKFWQEIQKNSFLMEDTIMSCRYVIYEILYCWDGQFCIEFCIVDPLFIDFWCFQLKGIICFIDPEKHICLKYGFCKKLLQISTDLEKKWGQKCSTGQRFICIEVTSYKIYTLVPYLCPTYSLCKDLFT